MNVQISLFLKGRPTETATETGETGTEEICLVESVFCFGWLHALFGCIILKLLKLYFSKHIMIVLGLQAEGHAMNYGTIKPPIV